MSSWQATVSIHPTKTEEQQAGGPAPPTVIEEITVVIEPSANGWCGWMAENEALLERGRNYYMVTSGQFVGEMKISRVTFEAGELRVLFDGCGPLNDALLEPYEPPPEPKLL